MVTNIQYFVSNGVEKVKIFGTKYQKDNTSKYNKGCLVILHSYNQDADIARCVTNERGYFEFLFNKNDLSAGSYRIEFYGSGYKPANGPLGDWETFYISGKGDDAITAILTIETYLLETNLDGTVPSYDGATTGFFIYKGVADDTKNWTVTVEKTDGNALFFVVDYSQEPQGDKRSQYQLNIHDLISNSATFKFTATNPNYPNLILEKIYTITKINKVSFVDLKVIPPFVLKNNSTYSPSSVTCKAICTNIQGTKTFQWYKVPNQQTIPTSWGAPVYTGPNDTFTDEIEYLEDGNSNYYKVIVSVSGENYSDYEAVGCAALDSVQDGFYVDLQNNFINIPYNSDGTPKTGAFDKAYTEIYVYNILKYEYVTPRTDDSNPSNINEYSISVTANENCTYTLSRHILSEVIEDTYVSKVQVNSITNINNSAYLDIEVKLFSGNINNPFIIKKRIPINIIKDGAPGNPGDPGDPGPPGPAPKWIELIISPDSELDGFLYNKDLTPVDPNQTVPLKLLYHNFTSPSATWYNNTLGDMQVINGISAPVLDPDMENTYYQIYNVPIRNFIDKSEIIYVKAFNEGTFVDEDIAFIERLITDRLNVILTNKFNTIRLNKDGTVPDGYLGPTGSLKSGVRVYYGGTLLTPNTNLMTNNSSNDINNFSSLNNDEYIFNIGTNGQGINCTAKRYIEDFTPDGNILVDNSSFYIDTYSGGDDNTGSITITAWAKVSGRSGYLTDSEDFIINDVKLGTGRSAKNIKLVLSSNTLKYSVNGVSPTSIGMNVFLGNIYNLKNIKFYFNGTLKETIFDGTNLDSNWQITPSISKGVKNYTLTRKTGFSDYPTDWYLGNGEPEQDFYKIVVQDEDEDDETKTIEIFDQESVTKLSENSPVHIILTNSTVYIDADDKITNNSTHTGTNYTTNLAEGTYCTVIVTHGTKRLIPINSNPTNQNNNQFCFTVIPPGTFPNPETDIVYDNRLQQEDDPYLTANTTYRDSFYLQNNSTQLDEWFATGSIFPFTVAVTYCINGVVYTSSAVMMVYKDYKPEPPVPGPGLVYRGFYSLFEKNPDGTNSTNKKIYFNFSARRDVVSFYTLVDNKKELRYYYLDINTTASGMYAENIGKPNNTPGVNPEFDSIPYIEGNWVEMQQFESVATDLLLAKDATILHALVMGTMAQEEGVGYGIIRSASAAKLYNGDIGALNTDGSNGGFYLAAAKLANDGRLTGVVRVGEVWPGNLNTLEKQTRLDEKGRPITFYTDETFYGHAPVVEFNVSGVEYGIFNDVLKGEVKNGFVFDGTNFVVRTMNFSLDSSGSMWAYNGWFSGTIRADAGIIGSHDHHWTINEYGITSTNGTVGFDLSLDPRETGHRFDSKITKGFALWDVTNPKIFVGDVNKNYLLYNESGLRVVGDIWGTTGGFGGTTIENRPININSTGLYVGQYTSITDTSKNFTSDYSDVLKASASVKIFYMPEQDTTDRSITDTSSIIQKDINGQVITNSDLSITTSLCIFDTGDSNGAFFDGVPCFIRKDRSRKAIHSFVQESLHDTEPNTQFTKRNRYKINNINLGDANAKIRYRLLEFEAMIQESTDDPNQPAMVIELYPSGSNVPFKTIEIQHHTNFEFKKFQFTFSTTYQFIDIAFTNTWLRVFPPYTFTNTDPNHYEYYSTIDIIKKHYHTSGHDYYLRSVSIYYYKNYAELSSDGLIIYYNPASYVQMARGKVKITGSEAVFDDLVVKGNLTLYRPINLVATDHTHNLDQIHDGDKYGRVTKSALSIEGRVIKFIEPVQNGITLASKTSSSSALNSILPKVDGIQSDNFTGAKLSGDGFALENVQEENLSTTKTISRLTVDDLIVRRKLVSKEYLLQNARAINGNLYIGSTGKVKAVLVTGSTLNNFAVSPNNYNIVSLEDLIGLNLIFSWNHSLFPVGTWYTIYSLINGKKINLLNGNVNDGHNNYLISKYSYFYSELADYVANSSNPIITFYLEVPNQSILSCNLTIMKQQIVNINRQISGLSFIPMIIDSTIPPYNVNNILTSNTINLNYTNIDNVKFLLNWIPSNFLDTDLVDIIFYDKYNQPHTFIQWDDIKFTINGNNVACSATIDWIDSSAYKYLFGLEEASIFELYLTIKNKYNIFNKKIDKLISFQPTY